MVDILTYSAMSSNGTDSSSRINTNERLLLNKALYDLNSTVEPESFAASYSSFLVTHYTLLPGLRDLALTACCLFGFRPSSPLREMEYITELSLRYIQLCPQSAVHPYGPVGTEWCVLPKGWYDAWRLYVGQQRTATGAAGRGTASVGGVVVDAVVSPPPTPITTGSNGSGKLGGVSTTTVGNGSAGSGSGGMKRSPPPPRPGAIDTTVLLRRPSTATSTGMSLSFSSILNSTTLSVPKAISKHGQLQTGLLCGRDIEVVAPAVYEALISWYGGGPPIVRKVVASSMPRRADSTLICDTRLSLSPRIAAGGSELELYPLSVNIYTCDNSGNMNPQPLCEGLLFSKTATVQEVTDYLCSTHTIEASRVRLWNYARPSKEHWKEQYILSPELTLLCGNIQDGQAILMEVSLVDGSWPRSLLHAYLDSEERLQQGVTEEEDSTVNTFEEEEGIAVGIEVESSANKEEGSGEVYYDEYTGTTGVRTPLRIPIGSKEHESTVMNAAMAVQSTLDQTGVTALTAAVGSVLGAPLPSANSPTQRRNRMRAPSLGPSYNVPIPAHKRNSGLVGMDNLGNTCYMNSCLQALLHTEPLTEYFLSKSYLRHLNLHSIHGFKGKLAHSFGRLAQELWSTSAGCITPRYFKYDIAHLHEQFSGNEQHDAHELLAFLLDGLSEDLNLVCEKPYTEQPDSDGRSDAVLADIWWGNHLKRDRSVIQALFSGQFKSVMTCSHPGCGYNSARFEPFNFLSVPVPEETERIVGVTVVPLQSQHTVYCEVRVPRNGVLQDIVNAVLQLGLEGLTDSQPGANKSTTAITSTTTSNITTNTLDPIKLRSQQINSTEQNEIWPAEIYFQAGELVSNRIKSFNSMERRVDTIRENECLVFYQVRRLAGDISSDSSSGDGSSGDSSTVAGSSGQGEEGVESRLPSLEGKDDIVLSTATTTATTATKINRHKVSSAEQPTSTTSHKDPHTSGGFDVNSLYLPNYNQSDRYVRVAFTQRRVRLRDANREYTSPELTATAANGNGSANSTEYFQLEPFGLSTLEVVPNKMRCSDLYRLVARRYAAFLKAPVRSLIHHKLQQRMKQQQQLRHTSSASSLHSLNKSSSSTGCGGSSSSTGVVYDSSSIGMNKDATMLPPDELPINQRLEQIHPAETDEVVGGAIPDEGFTLRLVSGGGAGNSTACSRCPWLQHCEGCVLPDSTEATVELRDGESLAVDWHFEVFQDLLDTAAICTVQRHYSDTQQQHQTGGSKNSPNTTTSTTERNNNHISTPLQRCLDKFTESEKLDDVVCPRCKNSNGNMQKSFTLWRLPPVLIIQLKRFQFDRTNRRKLNNHIDFPIENLDVFDYLATSRQRSLSGDAALDMSGGIGTTTSCGTSGGASACGATASSGASTTIATAITTIADAGSTTATEALQGSSSSTALAMSALYGDNLPIPTAIESTTDTSSKENTQPADPHPTTTGAALCTKYDLYSVIHHAGAMGGGHYATTARSLNIHTGPHTPPVTATGADTDTWYCYNDNIVNKVVDTRDISSSSAYVLFYMRQDMRQGDVLSLLRSQLSVPTGIDTVGDMKDELQYNNNSSINTINTTKPVLPPQKEEGNMHLTSTVEVPIVPNDMKHSTVLSGGQVGDGSEQRRGFTVDRKEQSLSFTGQNNSVNDSSTSSNNKVSNNVTTGTSNNKVSISNSRNNHTTSSSSDNNSSTSNSSTTATTTVTAAESGCVPS